RWPLPILPVPRVASTTGVLAAPALAVAWSEEEPELPRGMPARVDRSRAETVQPLRRGPLASRPITVMSDVGPGVWMMVVWAVGAIVVLAPLVVATVRAYLLTRGCPR